ncbi:MAG: type II toxin-antitoxin system PemK/MazF family toxin [Candidatus Woesearchaeota archaeon]|nr:type II toxin-antitoxin system PemK/MazF family toxin [Nanoarchaeota archaeon]MBU1974760.1 type II toxin-antitoxin system PemK/MazF family toxin [Nanoarchaeota archaeon]
MNQRDIVLLPYPFSDLTGTKVRPALVVSNNALNRKSDDCILVPLTTIIKEEPYSINISQGDLSSGELIKPSRIRVDKIFSVQKSLIIKKICSLDEETFARVKKEIMGML